MSLLWKRPPARSPVSPTSTMSASAAASAARCWWRTAGSTRPRRWRAFTAAWTISSGWFGTGSPTSRASSSTPSPCACLAERALQELHRTRPSEVRRCLVVARFRSVIVEGVVRALIDEDLIVDVRGLQRILVGGDAGIDAVVEPGVVEHHLRLDLAHVVRVGLLAVISDTSREIL